MKFSVICTGDAGLVVRPCGTGSGDGVFCVALREQGFASAHLGCKGR